MDFGMFYRTISAFSVKTPFLREPFINRGPNLARRERLQSVDHHLALSIWVIVSLPSWPS